MKEKVSQRVKNSYRRRYATALSKRRGNVNTDVKVIVVTGSTGKATTARYIRELLDEAGQTVQLFVPTDYESVSVRQVQEFLRDARKTHSTYAVLAIDSVALRRHVFGATPLEVVVVTNAEPSDQAVIADLLKSGPRYSVLNRDDLSYEMLATIPASAQTMTFGQHDEAEAKIDKMTLYRKGSEVKVIIDHQTKLKLATYLIGQVNLYNLTAAVTTLYVMGESIMSVDEGAARLETQPGNYEYLEVDGPYSAVLDCAPTDSSLRSVTTSAKQLTKRRLLVALQADSVSPEVIEDIAGLADRVVVVDVNDHQPSHGTIERVVSPDAAIKLVLRGARQGDTVLLAGPVFARPDEAGASYAQVTALHSVKD